MHGWANAAVVDSHFIMAPKPRNRSRVLVTKWKVEIGAPIVGARGQGAAYICGPL